MKILACALESSANLHLANILSSTPQNRDTTNAKNAVIAGDFGVEPSTNYTAANRASSAQTAEQLELFGIFDTEKFSAHSHRAFCDFKEFNAMGFIEVLPLILRARRAIRTLCEQALCEQIDTVLLIDSPAFNIPLARALRRANYRGKIVYFILPQVWAWKRGRVGKLAPLCDALVGILPFEQSFWGAKYHYFGNPIATSVGGYLREQPARKIIQISPANDLHPKIAATSCAAPAPAPTASANTDCAAPAPAPTASASADCAAPLTIAFLPGSRRREIAALMPVFNQLARLILRAAPDAKLLLSCALKGADYGDTSAFSCTKDTLAAVKAADFAYVCSGTASLQTALIGTPFALVYRARSLDFFIAKAFIKLPFIGLANIIADFAKLAPVHKEFIQNFTAEQLFCELFSSEPEKFFARSCELKSVLKPLENHQIAQLILRRNNANND